MTKLYYFAPIGFDFANEKLGYCSHSGAATNKVLSVSRALSTELEVIVLASPVITGSSKFIYPKIDFYVRNIQCFVFSVSSIKFINKIYSAYNYFMYSLRNIRKGDRVVIYNFFLEYLLAIILLRIAGVQIFLDIEDAPRTDEKGLRGLINRVSYRVISLFVEADCIVASHSLANYLNLKNYIVVYGVAEEKKNPLKFYSDKINVLYGGALLDDTGVNLFCDALRILSNFEEVNLINFIITGFGEVDKLKELHDELRMKNISINLCLDVSAQKYREILDISDVGLCLKIPSSHIGQTTFPSKVIEICSNDLLLVTTAVSDVSLLLNSDSAVIIESTATNLAESLLWVARNKDSASRIAKKGAEVIRAQTSAKHVREDFFKMLEAY